MLNEEQSSKDFEFISRAIAIAVQNVANGGGPFGAVVVRNGIIIAEGTNHVVQSNDPSAHAEIVAIRNACHEMNDMQLTDCTIYSSCEPCPMCLGAIYWARPKRLVFAATADDAAKSGFDDAFIYDELKLPSDQRSIPTVHINIEKSQDPFLAWIQNDQKISY